MADLEVVRRIVIQGQSQGVAQVAADLQKLSQSYEGVAGATTKTETATASVERALEREQKALDDSYRALKQLESARTTLDRATAQGLISTDQQNQLLQLAVNRFNQQTGVVQQATIAQRALAVASSGVSAQLVAMSAGAGPVGTFLSALGPWGFAAAAGIGLVTSTFATMRAEADRVGEKSVEIKKFSDITGLTTEQIRGLNKAGAEFGVSSDEIATGVERFTALLEEARTGTGTLYDQIRAINPALADELAQSRSTAEGLNAYANALKNAGSEAARQQIGRAGLGRGGGGTALALTSVAGAGGLDAQAQKYKQLSGITDEWTKHTAELRRQNEELVKSIANIKANAYADEVLERQNKYLQTEKEITLLAVNAAKNVGRQGGLTALFAPQTDEFGAPLNYAMTAPSTAGTKGIGSDYAADAAAAGAASENAISSVKALENAISLQANKLKDASSVLGQYADTTDQVRVKQLQLANAFLEGRISEDQYTRANDALKDQLAYLEGLRLKWGGVSSAVALQLQALQTQQQVYEATNQAAANRLTYEQQINALVAAHVPMDEAIALAKQQQATATAQMASSMQQQITQMQNQLQLQQASSDFDKARIEGAQKYQQIMNDPANAKMDPSTLQSMASQMGAMTQQMGEQKALAAEDAQAQRDADAATQRRAEASQKAALADRQAKIEAAQIKAINDQILQQMAYVPFGVVKAADGPNSLAYVQGKTIFQSNQGGFSQFNPKGYQSTTTAATNMLAMANQLYGQGGFDSAPTASGGINATPNATGFNNIINRVLGGGGSFNNAISQIITLGSAGTGALSSAGIGAANNVISAMSDTDPNKQTAIQQMIAALNSQPETIERDAALKTLTDSLQQLKQSTDQLNQTNQTMTDVLSPFYSQDPRSSFLGYRAGFATGGVMTKWGELPLRHYAGGGVTTTPQLFTTSENYNPEAIIPLQNGAVPVKMMGANDNRSGGGNVYQHFDNSVTLINPDRSAVDRARETQYQSMQRARRVMGGR